jgi:starvation-inducible outer membrane lipoprotein
VNKFLVILLITLLTILLTACATVPTIEGVKITDEERAACILSQDCTVWSKAELDGLVMQVYQRTLQMLKGKI